MRLSLRRIILFTSDMERMTRFDGDVRGLPLRADEPGWKNADGCAITLHNGSSRLSARPPKIGFCAKDVAAARTELLARGAMLRKLMSGDELTRCEVKDPEGNPFSISSRARVICCAAMVSDRP